MQEVITREKRMIIKPQSLSNQSMNRKGFIGGSDIPIILGLSSYKTPLELYIDKTSELGSAWEETEQQKWGKLLEPVILQEYANKHGVCVQSNVDFIHKDYPHLIGHLDGFIPETKTVIEIKTANHFTKHEWGEENSDEMYLPYLCQVAFYCSVANVDEAVVAVLFGGATYKEYRYFRDKALEDSIIFKANEFWKRIVEKRPPEPQSLIDLKLLFPKHVEQKIKTSNTQINVMCRLMNASKEEIKTKTKEQDNYKFEIMKYMEDAECLSSERGETLATWKTNKKGSRVFLVKGCEE